MARKMTPLQRKYRQAFRTVERRISKLESQGYVFDKSKLPAFRKNITTSALSHVKKYTERYLKNMPSTQFRVGVNKYTTGKRGAEIQASRRGKKAARTRRERDIARLIERYTSVRERYNGDEQYAETTSDEARLSEQAILEDALAEAINTGESNEFFAVFPNGDVVDAETGEIVFEPKAKPNKQVEPDKVLFDGYVMKEVGMSRVEGLDNLIADYEVSDNRWVREKAEMLRASFEIADPDTLADNLAHMPSDFIEYVQKILNNSGGTQEDINNNYAKLVEIQALIEGRTLEMGSLRNSFAD